MIGRPGLSQTAAYAAVGVALLLVVIKTAAWVITNSVAMLSSLIDSVLDVTASVLNLLAVHHAARPADAEHRFGHGKLEPLAGIVQTLFIGASGMFLLFEAVPRLFEPQPIVQADVGVAIMLISMALTAALVVYQRRVVRRTGSVAISADSMHYTGDLAMNGSIIVSLVLSNLFGWYVLDPVFAIGIAMYVLYNATRIARSSVDILMDRELPDAERALIESISLKHPEVYGVHELRTRTSGVKRFIQLHLEMDERLTLRRAHESAEEVEGWIREAFPDAEIIIHQDPIRDRRGG